MCNYESPGERILKIGPRLQVIIKHQVAYFFGTRCIYLIEILNEQVDQNVLTFHYTCLITTFRRNIHLFQKLKRMF